jgi:hypothetical protein
MHLPEPTGGSDFERVPAGTHLAVCYRFIDLGTQESFWKGEPRHYRKVLLSWELPHELMKTGELAGKPFTFHQRYTWSMSEKAVLRQHLEAWRGRAFANSDFGPGGFNIKNVIGKACLLNLIDEPKDGKVYTNLSGISPLMKGMETPKLINESLYLALTKDDFEALEFDRLSDRLKETIRLSPEYDALMNPKTATSAPAREMADLDDEIPF